jgi:hypothetical protein
MTAPQPTCSGRPVFGGGDWVLTEMICKDRTVVQEDPKYIRELIRKHKDGQHSREILRGLCVPHQGE